MITRLSHSVSETIALGEGLAACAQPDDMIVLTGDLGAGKTHFTKGFARGLGVSEEITSPTFNIVVEYEGSELVLLHFDLYRLEQSYELEDIDWYGLTESGAVSLVEWGDRFVDALPDEYLHLEVHVCEDGTRELCALGKGVRGEELAQQFAQLQV